MSATRLCESGVSGASLTGTVRRCRARRHSYRRHFQRRCDHLDNCVCNVINIHEVESMVGFASGQKGTTGKILTIRIQVHNAGRLQSRTTNINFRQRCLRTQRSLRQHLSARDVKCLLHKRGDDVATTTANNASCHVETAGGNNVNTMSRGDNVANNVCTT